ncbi:hypothetical protein BDA99DRAFT_563874 [Phascolomyces articulosus]|uniref:Uncharacterized protein n=1 Tax=Phascolomyces articulosus TaxID=60185 RepID=A0AAD5JRG2_9FUNG|nr:hypothetical protein BDA99DRAFT_563874 [Phascolomyces articulosus]
MNNIPPPFFNQQLFEQYTQKPNINIQNCAYQQIIRDVTITIDHIVQSQLLVLFDIRAQVNFLQFEPEVACGDTPKMIQYAPDLATGYIRQDLEQLRSKWSDDDCLVEDHIMSIHGGESNVFIGSDTWRQRVFEHVDGSTCEDFMLKTENKAKFWP